MWLIMFPPPPPTPIALILAPGTPAVDSVMLNSSFLSSS